MTRERIRKASIAVMTRKGYENTTIRDICKEADISIGTFYSYFDTKNDIFFVIYGSADEYFANTVAQLITGNSATEKVIDFFRYYAKLNLDTGIEMMKILYNPDNSWFIKKRPMQQVLEKIIKEGQESGELTKDMKAAKIVELLFIFMRGCCYNWCMLNGSYNLESQMAGYLKLIMPALQNSKKTNEKTHSRFKVNN